MSYYQEYHQHSYHLTSRVGQRRIDLTILYPVNLKFYPCREKCYRSYIHRIIDRSTGVDLISDDEVSQHMSEILPENYKLDIYLSRKSQDKILNSQGRELLNPATFLKVLSTEMKIHASHNHHVDLLYSDYKKICD
jgi:hypothetical protein